VLSAGIVIVALTALVLVAETLRHRRYVFPAHGWIGVALLITAEVVMFRGVQPVATYFTATAWTCYLLICDAAIFAIRGRSPLHDFRGTARMALLSIPLWLIFEAYNLRLANWTYVGLPESMASRWFGYAWAFATITPAILFTAELIESLGWWRRRARPIEFSRAAQNFMSLGGAALLVIPLLVPRALASYLFGMVWLGFIFFLDPINFRLGAPSLEGDLAEGNRARLYSLLCAGWVCGWLWEFWNYWAAAKWNYVFPIFQQYKIFEMPAPGYFGFPPFALECFVMYSFVSRLLGWEGRRAHVLQANSTS
jgi:hypothetical protein